MNTVNQYKDHLGIQQSGCDALLNLTVKNGTQLFSLLLIQPIVENNRSRLANESGISFIIEMMRNHESQPSIQESAFGILWNLAVKNGI
jgi:hypothetical protein